MIEIEWSKGWTDAVYHGIALESSCPHYQAGYNLDVDGFVDLAKEIRNATITIS